MDKKEIRKVFEELNKKVDQLFVNPDDFNEAIVELGRFNNISINNRILLLEQMKKRAKLHYHPIFRTFKGWKDKGVSVSKGSKAYEIIVKNSEAAYIKEDGEVSFLKNASEDIKSKVRNGELQETTIDYYATRNIYFHISDTNAEMEVLDKNDNIYLKDLIDLEDKEKYQEVFERISNMVIKNGIDVYEEEGFLAGGLVEQTLLGDLSIKINSQSDPATKIKSLFHELAHIELEHFESGFVHEVKETEAESVAYLMTNEYGIHVTKDNSFKYLSYYRTEETKKLQYNLFNRVFKAYERLNEKYGRELTVMMKQLENEVKLDNEVLEVPVDAISDNQLSMEV